MKLKELAQQALDIQNACNSCGLTAGMHEAMCELTKSYDTDGVNKHQITKLWLFKLMDLAGLKYDQEEFSIAYKYCLDITR